MQSAYDFVVIGSGFGGSVSALRLAEKGYRVLVLERGKRFAEGDFPRTNWDLRRYLWFPLLRCFGIQQITLLPDVLLAHGSGVGGGSLVYAGVLMEPDHRLFETPGWRDLADWRTLLRPHYATVRRMLGVAANPMRTPADAVLAAMAEEGGEAFGLRPTEVGVFFGEAGHEGEPVPDPYFGGDGPPRAGCTFCGGCMIGCRNGAKNSLDKNYLFIAERLGAEIRSEAEVTGIRPLAGVQRDGARYEVLYRNSTSLLGWAPRPRSIRCAGVVVAAHVMGTLKLLFHCRDVAKSLPAISTRLGEWVRTNSESMYGSTSRDCGTDYSAGVAITSVLSLDHATSLEPVRFPDGSSFVRLLATPLVAGPGSVARRVGRAISRAIRHPIDFLYAKFFARWARRTTMLLLMQTEDNVLRIRPGRHPFTLFRRRLVTGREHGERISPPLDLTERITREFAAKTNGIVQGSIPEALFGIPFSAHLLGGCRMGRNAEEGVVDVNCEVFNYPGLYVVDSSVVPGNPGINPSLTVAALAEYAMSRIPAKQPCR